MNTISSEKLGEMLYRLSFPNKDFHSLTPDVQDAYRRDAERLLAMLKDAEAG